MIKVYKGELELTQKKYWVINLTLSDCEEDIPLYVDFPSGVTAETWNEDLSDWIIQANEIFPEYDSNGEPVFGSDGYLSPFCNLVSCLWNNSDGELKTFSRNDMMFLAYPIDGRLHIKRIPNWNRDEFNFVVYTDLNDLNNITVFYLFNFLTFLSTVDRGLPVTSYSLTSNGIKHRNTIIPCTTNPTNPCYIIKGYDFYALITLEEMRIFILKQNSGIDISEHVNSLDTYSVSYSWSDTQYLKDCGDLMLIIKETYSSYILFPYIELKLVYLDYHNYSENKEWTNSFSFQYYLESANAGLHPCFIFSGPDGASLNLSRNVDSYLVQLNVPRPKVASEITIGSFNFPDRSGHKFELAIEIISYGTMYDIDEKTLTLTSLQEGETLYPEFVKKSNSYFYMEGVPTLYELKDDNGLIIIGGDSTWEYIPYYVWHSHPAIIAKFRRADPNIADQHIEIFLVYSLIDKRYLVFRIRNILSTRPPVNVLNLLPDEAINFGYAEHWYGLSNLIAFLYTYGNISDLIELDYAFLPWYQINGSNGPSTGYAAIKPYTTSWYNDQAETWRFIISPILNVADNGFEPVYDKIIYQVFSTKSLNIY